MSHSLFRPASLAVLMLGLAAAPWALAHPSLVRSSPAAGATVAPANQIELQFSERVLPRATRIELRMPHGRLPMAIPTASPQVSADGHTLRAGSEAPLSPGQYNLPWPAVGQDTHPITGDYPFTVH